MQRLLVLAMATSLLFACSGRDNTSPPQTRLAALQTQVAQPTAMATALVATITTPSPAAPTIPTEPAATVVPPTQTPTFVAVPHPSAPTAAPTATVQACLDSVERSFYGLDIAQLNQLMQQAREKGYIAGGKNPYSPTYFPPPGNYCITACDRTWLTTALNFMDRLLATGPPPGSLYFGPPDNTCRD